MKDKYYLATKGCSRGIQEKLILEVKDGEIKLHRGYTSDRFELNENGRPVSENGGMGYSIIGPLTGGQYDLALGDETDSRSVAEDQPTEINDRPKASFCSHLPYD